MPTLLQSQADNVSSAFCAFGPPGLKFGGQGLFGQEDHPARGRTESAFIVKNTFLEVPEDEHNDSSEEDIGCSPPFFRRRRGSSFCRSASEPRFPQRIEASILEAEVKMASYSTDVEAQDEGSTVSIGQSNANFQSLSLQSALVDDEFLEVVSEIPVQQSGFGNTANVHDAARHSACMQQQYYHNSQLASAFAPVDQIAGPLQSKDSAVGWPAYAVPQSSWSCHPSQMAGTFTANDTDAVTAAMYAGFNAGLMAALAANQQATSSNVKLAKKASPQIQARHDSARNCDDRKPTSCVGRDKPRHYGVTATIGDHSQGQQFNGLSALAQLPFHDPKLRGATRQSSSGVSDASTTVSHGVSSLHGMRTPSHSPEPSRAACHLIWCDQRAFKELSSSWRKQLEVATGIQVKTHKTSEKCIRLLRKKQHSHARPPCVFLVSWANAPTLLPFLTESPNIMAKVILLCDTDMCRGRNRDAAETLASGYPFVAHLAASWADAVEAASILVGEFQGLH